MLARCVGALALLLAVSPRESVTAADGIRPVTSLLEMRHDNVVVQEWDLSCGAAALATILNHQYDDPVSEREVAAGLIKRDEYLANPDLVRSHNGFSLLDLKRFVDQRGYQGIGYGSLEFQDLIDMAPVMVPVDLNGYPHFVVFRGALGNRVLVADPGFGNRTMLVSKFQSAWLDYPEFGKVGFVVAPADGAAPPDRLAPTARDFVSLR
jgi:predicted double-glycine peptidase